MPEFAYTDLLPQGEDTTPYRLVTSEGVSTVEGPDGRTFLQVEPEALRKLARRPSTTSSTTCARPTWRSCAASSTTPRRRATTSSWRWTC